MKKTNIVDWKTITDFVIDAFVGYGIPRTDAEICADVLLESDKRGIESHGVNRFKPVYLDRIKAGIQNAVTEIEIIKETPTTAVIDGHHGMGQVIGHKAMSMAIAKAKEYGMGMVVVRNSCHYGIAGYYTTMATKAGCIGMTGTNARPSVAPTHGVEGMFGTNPFTLGVPTDEEFDFNFDCATSITQNGKVEYYERIGEDVHPGTIIDIEGNAVEGDAGVALRKIRGGTAALTTLGGIGEALGGYKGYGFALAVEFFSSILQDGAYGKDLDGKDENGNIRPYQLGHWFIAIDTDHFLGAEIARKKGAIVYERFDDVNKTKGFALQYLVKNIEKDYGIESFEGYFIFDADNLLKSDYISKMNDAFDSGEKIITSYRNTKNFDENWVASTYAIHWIRSIRTNHRARSVLRLATNIQGTGFLFAKACKIKQAVLYY